MGLAECFELSEALLDVSKISLLPEKLLGCVQRMGPDRSEILADQKSQNHNDSSMMHAMNVYTFSEEKNIRDSASLNLIMQIGISEKVKAGT